MRSPRSGPSSSTAVIVVPTSSPEARASGKDVGTTITAVLDYGPQRGERIEARVGQGRPPSTIDVPANDGSTCRYCLARWAQSGPSAIYTFLYRV